MIDKMKKLMVLFSFIFLIWLTSAYAPRKLGLKRNCSNTDDEEMKTACEIEKQFFKFTESTWTRVMSTTCCSFESHYPQGYYYLHDMRKTWEVESWEVSKLNDLVLKLSSQIYAQSKNKQKTLNNLAWIFNYCSEKWKTAIIRSVCNYYAYDMIGKNPKLSTITFSDIISNFKKNEFIRRTAQYSDLDEIYTPISYQYAWIRHMYMFWEYALGLMDWYDYFSNDGNGSDWKRILVMKAWDTHWQDFAIIERNIWDLDDSELTKEWNNLILTVGKEIRSWIYKEWTLKWKYRLNNDWTWSYIECDFYQRTKEKEILKKEKLTRCENELWVKLKTILN